MSPSTWLIAILEHPGYEKNVRQLGTAHNTIADTTLSPSRCLLNLTNEQDPVLIFTSKLSKKIVTIHNIFNLGSTRINNDPIPFAIMGFGTFNTPVTFDHEKLLQNTNTSMTPIVPSAIEILLTLDNVQKLKNHKPTTDTDPAKVDSPDTEEGEIPNDVGPGIGWTTKRFRQAYLLPPTLIEIMANLPNADPARAFLSCRSRIHELIDPPNETDTEESPTPIFALPTHDIEEYKTLLQFLFATTHNQIPGSEVEPRLDPIFLTKLEDLTTIRLVTTNPLCPTNQTAPSTTPAGAVDFTGLQNAVDRLASTSSNKKPGWDRLPTNKKQMILHLSSRDEVNPALHPSPDFRELLQQRNSAEASDHLLSQLQDQYGVDANLSGMLSASLYTARLTWDRRDTPSNFTGFLMARMSGNDFDEINSEKTLATNLKHLSGAPLSDIEAQKATKSKLKRPNTPDEAMYMIRNMHRICCMLFGRDATLCKRLKRVVDHIRDNHLTYSSIAEIDSNFPTKIVYYIDISCQALFRSALTEPSCKDVDWASIDFGYHLRLVNMRSFNIILPKSLHQHKRANPTADDRDRKKPKKEDQKAKETPKPNQKTDLARNPQVLTCARLKTGEQWSDVFPKGRIPPDCPKFNGKDVGCCVKYHSGGTCNRGKQCDRAESHGDLDTKTIDLYCTFIKNCRPKAKSA
jgi:hypothetical protein